MLPPFAIETEEGKAMARHCSMGIEPRVSAERLILLDTQVLPFLYLACSSLEFNLKYHIYVNELLSMIKSPLFTASLFLVLLF